MAHTASSQRAPGPAKATLGGRGRHHATAAERAALGRGLRKEVPRSSHAQLNLTAERPDPISLLEEQAATRVPELVPIRHGRMLASPFAFFRGAALVMASDLATTPTTGISAQICGDAHLSNFGLFGSPERRLVFDVNDFDETLPGPWEWDVKRLCASIAIAGRDRNFSLAECRQAVRSAAFSYRQEMRTLAAASNLDVWYRHVDAVDAFGQYTDRLRPASRKATAAQLARARTRDSMQALGKLARWDGTELRIISDPPLLVPIDELVPEADATAISEYLANLFRAYTKTLRSDVRHLLDQYRLVHVARKVVGVGSVGTRAWIGLLVGRDGSDPLFLQAKEAEASVLERFVGRSRYDNHGARVVAGQHLMQAVSDIFLGWHRAIGVDGIEHDFYFRQLRDWKGSIDLERMVPEGLAVYGKLCGTTLARAHGRSGDRIAMAAYLGSGPTFDSAIVEFADCYAEQSERDHQALRDAVASGRLEATSGL